MSGPDAPKDRHWPDDTTRRRRILFRATHRGTHENDILIGGFVRARLDVFSPVDLDAIEAIMDFPDTTLADWLTGRQPIPPEADTPMLRAMRQSAVDGESRLQPSPAGGIGQDEGGATGPAPNTLTPPLSRVREREKSGRP